MLHPTHTYPNTTAKSDVLDFHHIDPNTLSQAIADLNKIVDAHAPLLRKDKELSAAVLRYENLLIDAQSGGIDSLKLATSPEEFDTVLDALEASPHRSNAALNYLGLHEALLEFKAYYLSASRVD